MIGSLIVVQAANRAAVERFSGHDLFRKAELFADDSRLALEDPQPGRALERWERARRTTRSSHPCIFRIERICPGALRGATGVRTMYSPGCLQRTWR
jgi:hypothetical protein